MHRNVVLVTIDSLRADHCGFHGYDRATTPTLDGMADDGIAFEHAIAPGPKTPESTPVMFTGRRFAREQYDLDALEWDGLVRPHVRRHRMLAERLADRGYDTIGFSPNGFSSSHFGFDRGFDRFEDFLDDELRPGFELPGPVRGLVKWVRREGNWKLWDGYYDRIREAVAAASEPYFLWVFLMDVHSPYQVPRRHRSQSWPGMVYTNARAEAAADDPAVRERVRTAYDDTIRYVDEFLARAREEFPGDPAFVVTSDHGEALGDHGHYGHEYHLYEENLHVPLVVADAGESGTVERPVSLARLPDLVTAVADGDPVLDRFDDGADAPVAAASGEGGRLAVRTRRFKLIRELDAVDGADDPGVDGTADTLYDLVGDPEETTDASEAFPAVAELLGRYANRYRRSRREERRIGAAVRGLAADGRL